eukprot:2391614-Pleurochrysis_carterae.AAC.1
MASNLANRSLTRSSTCEETETRGERKRWEWGRRQCGRESGRRRARWSSAAAVAASPLGMRGGGTSSFTPTSPPDAAEDPSGRR